MRELTSSPHNKFLIYYQALLAVGAVAIFFTKLDIFLEQQGFVIPLYWLLAFLGASIPLWTSIFTKIKYIPPLIWFWLGLYFAMSSISILTSPGMPSMQLLEDQIRAMLFFLLMLLFFAQHTLVQNWVKVAMLLVSLMNVFNHIYEFLNPLAFGALHAPGRPGGFYIDSNEAGCALILGMIFSIDLVKPKYRLCFASIIGLGVVLSFSRGSILGWLIVVLLLMFKKIIPTHQVIYLVIAIVTILLIVGSQFNNLSRLQTADGSPLFNQDTLSRVELLVDPFSEKQDTSRVSLVEDAWQSFAEQPVFGKGIGNAGHARHISSRGTAQQPHNTYLKFMIEYGFLGIIIYPFLLFSSIWKAQGKVKDYSFAFVVFLLIWGIFSHTTISSFFILLSIAFMACLNKSSQNNSHTSSIKFS